MFSYTILHGNSRKNLWILFKSIPTASTPDSRWGLFQICLSLFFFFFGLAIAAIQFYDTPLWGCELMVVAIVLSAIAVLMIFFTVALGWYFWSKQDKDPPILIVTQKSQLQINPENVRLETDNEIKITTDKFEIDIRSLKKEGDTNGE